MHLCISYYAVSVAHRIFNWFSCQSEKEITFGSDDKYTTSICNVHQYSVEMEVSVKEF